MDDPTIILVIGLFPFLLLSCIRAGFGLFNRLIDVKHVSEHRYVLRLVAWNVLEPGFTLLYTLILIVATPIYAYLPNPSHGISALDVSYIPYILIMTAPGWSLIIPVLLMYKRCLAISRYLDWLLTLGVARFLVLFLLYFQIEMVVVAFPLLLFSRIYVKTWFDEVVCDAKQLIAVTADQAGIKIDRQAAYAVGAIPNLELPRFDDSQLEDA